MNPIVSFAYTIVLAMLLCAALLLQGKSAQRIISLARTSGKEDVFKKDAADQRVFSWAVSLIGIGMFLAGYVLLNVKSVDPKLAMTLLGMAVAIGITVNLWQSWRFWNFSRCHLAGHNVTRTLAILAFSKLLCEVLNFAMIAIVMASVLR